MNYCLTSVPYWHGRLYQGKGAGEDTEGAGEHSGESPLLNNSSHRFILVTITTVTGNSYN